MPTLLLTGTAKWAKVRKPADEGFDKGSYTIDLYMSPESFEDFKAAKLIMKEKKDADGETYVRFKRKHEEMNYAKNENQVNGPPKVYLKDAQSGEYNLWTDGLIGNGSKVAISVSVYKTQNGNAHRLLRVFIDDLVEYTRANDNEAPAQAKLPF